MSVGKLSIMAFCSRTVTLRKMVVPGIVTMADVPSSMRLLNAISTEPGARSVSLTAMESSSVTFMFCTRNRLPDSSWKVSTA